MEYAVRDLGLSGLQFLPPQMTGYGDTGSWDRDEFRPFWDGIAALDIPVFFSFGTALMPDSAGPEDGFLENLETLVAWMERYPDVTVVITHGLAWRLFARDDRIDLPETV